MLNENNTPGSLETSHLQVILFGAVNEIWKI